MPRPSRNGPAGHDGKSRVPLASDEFTDEQLGEYFTSLSHGVGPDLAARALGQTGTRMKRFLVHDPAFRERYELSREEGKAHYRERLAAQARLRALHQTNPSDRILEVELATHVPGYEHLRRDRVKLDGKLEHAIVLDPAQLDALPLERLLVLRELLAELGGGVVVDGELVEGEVRELGPGE